MAFMVKHVVGGQLKNLTGGLTEEKSEGEKSDAAAQGMTQEEFEQYQQQLEEEKTSSTRPRSSRQGTTWCCPQSWPR
uniref:Complexin 3b n=1 Tax=Poecilia latipinna TaxID=48699 RepID=A0A3B3VIA7_9TELE